MLTSIMSPPVVSVHQGSAGPGADCKQEWQERRNSDSPERRPFSSERNPFLFPLDLLCQPSGRTDCCTSSLANDDLTSTFSDAPSCRWWLVHTKPRQEKKLADELRLLEVPHYLPATRCKALTRGRTRVTWAPQFPSYLFLSGDDEQRLAALKTNRVVATRGVANPTQLCRHLWDLADLIEKGVPLRIEERLVAGQRVRVKAGLLRDKCGIIMKRGGKTRLFLYVAELLGGVSLEIEQHLLEPY